MGGHCGTAEGTRRRAGGGPSALPRLFAGARGEKESWQDPDSLTPSTGSGGHTVFMMNLVVGWVGGWAGMLWSFKENKLPSSPYAHKCKINSFGILSKVLALGNASSCSSFSCRNVVCSSLWFCFAQEHLTKVNANLVKMWQKMLKQKK